MSNSFYQKIATNKKKVNNHLCIGLDPDIDKIPDHFQKNINGLEKFLFEVIENTSDLCIAYKPNISFFEAFGIEGLKLLARVRKAIPDNTPVILDGKRGDIGNTSKMQARYIFDYFGADASTLHPYMGTDSLSPFFEYKDKFNFVLALTSNPGAKDFEKLKLESGVPLYQKVVETCVEWNKTYDNIGLVVGATQNELPEIRKTAKNLLFLIPGIGKQGGSYSEAVKNGNNKDSLSIINISRSILYCSKQKNFISEIRKKCLELCC
jgi:orotidine-5'-phosphate decarboxylase